MAEPVLVDFVRDALKAGRSREEIAGALAAAGWPADTVADALDDWAPGDFPLPVPRPRPYLSAREAFLTVVLFIALGLSVTNFGVLLFQFVNIALPDPAASDYALETVASRMRWSVSALVVAFPLFLFLSTRMERERRANPALAGSRIRKWLTYAALVIAAAVLMGDMMAAIYQFLGGEMSLRFALKVAIIGAIAGTTFLHYIAAVETGRASSGKAPLRRRVIGLAASVLIACAVAAAFALIDSPERMRERRLDEARLVDLSEIATTVDCVWTIERRVPADMTDLEETARRIAAARSMPSFCYPKPRFDPATGGPYELAASGGAGFTLCAEFAQPWPPRGASQTNWPTRAENRFGQTRGPGRYCYELTAKVLKFDK